jgi:hypothetical protein
MMSWKGGSLRNEVCHSSFSTPGLTYSTACEKRPIPGLQRVQVAEDRLPIRHQTRLEECDCERVETSEASDASGNGRYGFGASG